MDMDQSNKIMSVVGLYSVFMLASLLAAFAIDIYLSVCDQRDEEKEKNKDEEIPAENNDHSRFL